MADFTQDELALMAPTQGTGKPQTTDDLWTQANDGQTSNGPLTTDQLWDQASKPDDKSWASKIGTVWGYSPVGSIVESMARSPSSGSFSDYFFTHTAFGHILNSFSEGEKNGWGDSKLGISPETEKGLQQAGIFNDYKDGKSSLSKSVNETWMRPAAVAFDTAVRLGAATLSGLESASHELGKETDSSFLQKGLPELIEYAGNTGMPEFMAHTEVAQTLADARANRIIGAGEKGYFGFRKEPAALEDPVTNQAIKQSNSQQSDLHTAIRTNNPELMGTYDGLKQQAAQQLDTVQKATRARDNDPRVMAAKQEIENITGKVAGAESRLTKKAAGRLQEIREGLAAFLDTDTEDMTAAKEGFASTQQELWGLSRDVRSAYRTEYAKMGGSFTDVTPLPDEPVGPPPANPISADVSSRLQTAGRPKEEADATGAVVQALYETHAARFDGKLGSARDIFDSEHPEITNKRAAQGKAADMALSQSMADVEHLSKDKFNPANEDYWGDFWQKSKDHAQTWIEKNSEQFPGLAKDAQGLHDWLEEKGANGLASNISEWGHKVKSWTDDVVKARESKQTGRDNVLPFKPEDATLEQKSGKKITKGSIDVTDSGRNIIHLFKQADASTFLHETAHDWLERLVRDSERDDAPADLINDVAIIKQWLKAGDTKPSSGMAFTRARHEQFARGFERYFMEGRAPTRELAGIFQKFKDWLTKIYRIVSNLKSPINSDIRDVFARMLTTDPIYDGIVITPEEEAAAHANTTAPVPDQTAPVNAAASENATAEQSAQQKTPATVESKPAKPKSNEEKGPQETRTLEQSKFIRADGDVFISKISSDEDVHQYLRDDYDRYKDDHDARGGKVSVADIISVGDNVGIKPRKLKGAMNKLNKLSADSNVPLSAAVFGLKRALEASTRNIMKLVEDDDYVAFAAARETHLQLYKTLIGVRAEWGRTGLALQLAAESGRDEGMMTELLQSSYGMTLEQTKRMANSIRSQDTLAKAAKQLNDSDRSSFGDMVLEFARNNYITGPITHLTYSMANKGFALYKALPEPLFKAGMSGLQELLTGEKGQPGERIYAREAVEGTKELFKQWMGFAGHRDGLIATKMSFLKGSLQPLAKEGTVGQLAYARAVRKELHPGTPEFDAAVDKYTKEFIGRFARRQAELEGHKDEAFLNRVEELRQNYDSNKVLDQPHSIWTKTKHIPNVKIFGVNTHLGDIVRFPGERFVGPIHAYDRAVGFQVNRQMLITRQALDEGLTGGKLAQRIAELKNDTPDPIMYHALEDAWEQALMGHTGDFTRRYQALLNYRPAGVPVLGFVEPFVSIPSQIAKSGMVDRGPLGLLSARVWKDILGKNGRLAQAETSGKLSLGLTVGSGVIAAVMEGLINPGQDNTDYKKASIEQIYNGLPHSFKVGEMSYAFDRLGPIGAQLAEWSDIGKAIQIAEHGEYKKAVFYAAYASLENTKEMFEGFSDLFKAIDDANRYGDQYINNFLTTAFIPGSIGMQQLSKILDPYKRESHGILNMALSKIPGWNIGLSEKFGMQPQYPRVDVFGEPEKQPEYRGVYAQQLNEDPVYKALAAAGFFLSPVSKSIRGVLLTDEQHYQFAVMAGHIAKQQLDQLLQIPGWDNMSISMKHDMIKSAVETARETARNVIILNSKNTDNDIMKKSRDTQNSIVGEGTQ